MDVHSFINKLRDDKRNNKFVNDIIDSIYVLKSNKDADLLLDVPSAPKDLKKRLKAKCIHGHVFEDFVLKAALDDSRKTIVVKDESQTTVKDQMKKRKEEFKEIYEETMKKKYEVAMTNAGSRAWKILSTFTRNGNVSKQVSEVKFEDWVKNNNISSQLMGSLRADFVARTGEKVFLVDLKFSTTKRQFYEEQYLIDGIIQVLIYAILMGVDPRDLTLGVLVYYGREGETVLYTTDKRNDDECMSTMMKLAGMKNTALQNGKENAISSKTVNNLKQSRPIIKPRSGKLQSGDESLIKRTTRPLKGILKNATAKILPNQKQQGLKKPKQNSSMSEFSDQEEEEHVDMDLVLITIMSKAFLLLVFVVVVLIVLGWAI
ncbi:hypothetical protein FSP39_009549 [Pinctada imbricata]|uniref:Uncharacterized protein n=1 Tax=Pinctada imbricata TaxID=66713 RepID=A0AA89C3H9_PINIB|nr:hypothetical protein FSP39_009549 [Pinctada imbricata]